MISVCITLGFSLQHLSNLEDHACIVVQNCLPYQETTTNKEKHKTKRNLTGMHQPLKREKQMYFTVLKMQKTFHSSYNLFFRENRNNIRRRTSKLLP